MFNLPELEGERTRKALAARDIIEKAEKAEGGSRPLSPDEVSVFDKLQEDIKNLNAQIDQVLATQKRRAELDKITEELNKPSGRQTAPGDKPLAPKVENGGWFSIPATARRTGTLKAFKGDRADEKAYKAGQWILGVLFNNEKAKQWCYTNYGSNFIQNALSTTSNADGGFLVPEEMARTIIDLREEYGVFRRYARVWPMGSDTLVIPRRTGGVTWGPIGEAATITDTSPTGDNVRLVATKVGGLIKLSSEVNEDSVIDIADWCAREFAWGAAKFEDEAGFIGDGTSTYAGISGLRNILTEASALTGAVMAASGVDTFAEVTATDLANLMGTLPAYARPNAKFFCSMACAEVVFGRLQAGAGGNTIGTISGERTGRSYLGHEIVIAQALPTTTSTINGTLMLLFGDLSKSSALGDRRQLRVMPSEHRYLETDQIGIRATARIDIVNHDYGTTSVAGPIVALIGNT